jgi:hypothetical protein
MFGPLIVMFGLDPNIWFSTQRADASIAVDATDARVRPEHDGGRPPRHDGSSRAMMEAMEHHP